jgi:hypothetical protein
MPMLHFPSSALRSGGSIDASSFSPEDEEALNETLGELLVVLEQLDERIGPMLEQDGAHFNKRCGGCRNVKCNSVVKLTCTAESASACTVESASLIWPQAGWCTVQQRCAGVLSCADLSGSTPLNI